MGRVKRAVVARLNTGSGNLFANFGALSVTSRP
jgi:hypothetical protein